MNARIIHISFLLIAFTGKVFPEGDPAKSHLLRLYAYGTPAYSFNDSCQQVAAEKYGFKTVVKAGCVLKPGEARRWERHNNKVHRKLDKRNGPDWWDKYIREASDCSRKQ